MYEEILVSRNRQLSQAERDEMSNWVIQLLEYDF